MSVKFNCTIPLKRDRLAKFKGQQYACSLTVLQILQYRLKQILPDADFFEVVCNSNQNLAEFVGWL